MFRNILKFSLALVIASSANATMMTFKLELFGTGSGVSGSGSTAVSNDRPHVRLTNTSDAGVEIVRFVLSVGNTAYNYDWGIFQQNTTKTTTLNDTPTGVTAIGRALVSTPAGTRADGGGNGQRGDLVEWTFTGFSPNEGFRFSTDIDPDTTPFDGTALDYRTILFNNGVANNAVAQVTFRHLGIDKTVELILGDDPANLTSYSFIGGVPEPGTMSMIGLGVVAVGLSRIRRRPNA